MAATSYGVNDSQTVKLWGRKLFRESLNQTYLSRFIGTDSNSVIQRLDNMEKGPGDRVTTILRTKLTGNGISGDSTLEGYEEALVTYTDNLLIDQLRHAVRSGGRMSEQRIPFSVRKEANDGLSDWWAERVETSLMNQLAGYSAETDTSKTGMNAITAPDSSHQMWTGGANNDETLSSSQTITLGLIDNLVEKAETLADAANATKYPIIRPVMVDGSPYYLLFIHPYQARDLRTSTTTGQWLDIQKSAMQGGKVESNPIFTGALGVYNQVILHKSAYVPQGVNSSTSAALSTVRRAVFCGAQAATIAYGQDSANDQMVWTEELFDYKNQLGVSAGMIWGAKRTIYNSASFGSIVLSTYAAAHTS